jgi:hypothetical protein
VLVAGQKVWWQLWLAELVPSNTSLAHYTGTVLFAICTSIDFPVCSNIIWADDAGRHTPIMFAGSDAHQVQHCSKQLFKLQGSCCKGLSGKSQDHDDD